VIPRAQWDSEEQGVTHPQGEVSIEWPTLESFSMMAPPFEPGAGARRSLRRDVSDEDCRLFRDETSFRIADLSMGGVAIRMNDASDFLSFQAGSAFSGTLMLSGKPFVFEGKIRHQRGGLIGCEFQNPTTSLIAQLALLLDPAGLGPHMKPCVPPEHASHAFAGPANTAVFVWELGGEISQFAIYVLGVVVQWKKDRGNATGVAQFSNSIWKILHQDPGPAAMKLEAARRLLTHSPLPKTLVRALLKDLG
jgi:hypothetical protein